MRRVGRYILNTLTVLSLVLCVATVVRCLKDRQSQRRALSAIELQLDNESKAITVASANLKEYERVHGPTTQDARHLRHGPTTQDPRHLPLEWMELTGARTRSLLRRQILIELYREASERRPVPFPRVALPMAALPLLWPVCMLAVSRRRSLRQQRGLCLVCGYDLIPSPKPVLAILPGEQQQQQQQQPTPPP